MPCRSVFDDDFVPETLDRAAELNQRERVTFSGRTEATLSGTVGADLEPVLPRVVAGLDFSDGAAAAVCAAWRRAWVQSEACAALVERRVLLRKRPIRSEPVPGQAVRRVVLPPLSATP